MACSRCNCQPACTFGTCISSHSQRSAPDAVHAECRNQKVVILIIPDLTTRKKYKMKKTLDISRLSDRLHPSCGLPYFLGSMRIADTWQETALDEMPRPLNKEVKMQKWPNMKSSRQMLSSVPSPTLHLDHLRVVWFQYFLWTSPAETL